MNRSTILNLEKTSVNLSVSFGNRTNSPVASSLSALVLSGLTLFGLITNGLICLAITKTKKLHTPTFYLVFNMAISDCIFLVSGLSAASLNAILSSKTLSVLSASVACKLVGFANVCSVIASTLTLSAISIDRNFILTTKSCRRTLFNSYWKLAILIGLIWSIGTIAAIPFAVLMTIYPSSRMCDIMNRRRTFNVTYFILLLIVACIIPAIIVMTKYAKIMSVLAKGIDSRRTLSTFELTRKHHIKLIKSLSIVTIIFLSLTCPILIVYIIFAFSGQSSFNYMLSLSQTQAQIIQICFIVGYFSCLANPIIYFCMNTTLRQALTCKLQCRYRVQSTIHMVPVY
ncbi:Neuropeptide Y receptor type 2 [Trichoplax sp. H2]|nr:Neuropeptide Y receptor type 2 [Trichoplax sp. H2]|eukprot:RDD37895.1 Neuropeptide Y receptor type 2 [Trichoplax sp. H2]